MLEAIIQQQIPVAPPAARAEEGPCGNST